MSFARPPLSLGKTSTFTNTDRRLQLGPRAVDPPRVRADTGVQPGTVFIAFCYVEAAANLLTVEALDPYGKIPEFKYCAVRVSKAETKVTGKRVSWFSLGP
jgi:predicted molibdopterin-dependent oxidoreductase YjgC